MRINLTAAVWRMLVVGVSAGLASAATAQNLCDPCAPAPPLCPPAYGTADAVVQPSAQPTPSDAGAPAPETQPAAPEIDFSAPAVASSSSASSSRSNFAPNMIGDFFGPAAGGSFGPAPSPTDIAGRVRFQDNNSALLQDRVYIDYNYFHNARIGGSLVEGVRGSDVNRVTFGLEKIVIDDFLSFDIRMPMASTVSSDGTVAGRDGSEYEFGNLALSAKVSIYRDCCRALTAGLGVGLPTSDDVTVVPFRIKNDSVHIVPYIAYTYTPTNSDYFAHVFTTMDVAANSNPVEVAGVALGQSYYDPTLLSFDLAIGKWFYRDNCCNATVNAMAWSAELHYTEAVNTYTTAAPPQIFGETDDLSVLNGTLGAHAQVNRDNMVTAAYSFPLTQDDRPFDAEFRLFWNRNY